MKLLIAFILLLASCSPRHYDYQPQNKPGVTYKKAHKQSVRFIHLGVISFFAGYFIVSSYDFDNDK